MLSNYDAADLKKRGKLMKKINCLRRAQIILYGILNVHSKSVELALICNDTTLAKIYANKFSYKVDGNQELLSEVSQRNFTRLSRFLLDS